MTVKAIVAIVLLVGGCRDRTAPRRAPTDDAAAASPATVAIVPAPASIVTPMRPWPGAYGPACPAGYGSVSAGVVSCATCLHGRVHCWGEPSSKVLRAPRGEVTIIDGVTDAAEVAASFDLACVRTRTGRVRCWGGAGSVATDAGPPASIVDISLPAPAVAIGFAGGLALRGGSGDLSRQIGHVDHSAAAQHGGTAEHVEPALSRCPASDRP